MRQLRLLCVGMILSSIAIAGLLFVAHWVVIAAVLSIAGIAVWVYESRNRPVAGVGMGFLLGAVLVALASNLEELVDSIRFLLVVGIAGIVLAPLYTTLKTTGENFTK